MITGSLRRYTIGSTNYAGKVVINEKFGDIIFKYDCKYLNFRKNNLEEVTEENFCELATKDSRMGNIVMGVYRCFIGDISTVEIKKSNSVMHPWGSTLNRCFIVNLYQDVGASCTSAGPLEFSSHKPNHPQVVRDYNWFDKSFGEALLVLRGWPNQKLFIVMKNDDGIIQTDTKPSTGF